MPFLMTQKMKSSQNKSLQSVAFPVRLHWGSERITGQLRLGRSSGRLWSNLLLTAGSAMVSDQAAEGFNQSGLEKLRGWKLQLGDLCRCLSVLKGNKVRLTTSLKLFCFSYVRWLSSSRPFTSLMTILCALGAAFMPLEATSTWGWTSPVSPVLLGCSEWKQGGGAGRRQLVHTIGPTVLSGLQHVVTWS